MLTTVVNMDSGKQAFAQNQRYGKKLEGTLHKLVLRIIHYLNMILMKF